MSRQVKRIEIKEFRARGYLQELNRLFLHRLGLALEVIVDEETGEEKLGGVWDFQEDPEGILFGEYDQEKAEQIYRELKSKRVYRSNLPECDEAGIQVHPLTDEIKDIITEKCREQDVDLSTWLYPG